MSYFEFHLLFTIPIATVLLLLLKPDFRLSMSLIALSVIACIYTIPWDSHLIDKQVWTYPTDLVLGTIGLIPYEEYFFMLIQPFIAAGVYLFFSRRSESAIKHKAGKAWVVLPILTWLACSGLGVWLMNSENTYYLGIILAWATPILALQWLVGASEFITRSRDLLLALLVTTVYLCLADRIAIEYGIWHIQERWSTELLLMGLPIEEILFFIMTNLLCIQGIILFKRTEGKLDTVRGLSCETSIEHR